MHSLIPSKVFISFHWGVALGEYFSGPFSGWSKAREIRDMLRKQLDTYAYIDTIGPSDEDPGKHALMTTAAIKNCNVFICLMSDAYVNNRRCKREFGQAVGASKFIVPVRKPPQDTHLTIRLQNTHMMCYPQVLLPQQFDSDGEPLITTEGATAWTSDDVSKDWWRHADKVPTVVHCLNRHPSFTHERSHWSCC